MLGVRDKNCKICYKYEVFANAEFKQFTKFHFADNDTLIDRVMIPLFSRYCPPSLQDKRSNICGS